MSSDLEWFRHKMEQYQKQALEWEGATSAMSRLAYGKLRRQARICMIVSILHKSIKNEL